MVILNLKLRLLTKNGIIPLSVRAIVFTTTGNFTYSQRIIALFVCAVIFTPTGNPASCSSLYQRWISYKDDATHEEQQQRRSSGE
jgi:hypothetical protein